MKKLHACLTISIFFLTISDSIAQNTFPSSGNVGIGTTTPQANVDLYMNASTSPQYGLLLHTGSFVNTTNAANSYFIKTVDDGGSSTKFIVKGDGTVGIGTASPQANVDLYMSTSTSPQYGLLLHTGSFVNTTNAANSYFIKTVDDGSGLTKFIVRGDGFVGINTTPATGYALSVNGSAIFTRAVVKLYGNWPDYVFKKQHPLISLNKLSEYIQKNEHLPGIPSAAEMRQNGKIDLGEMNVKLLEKVEELTLYMIALENKCKKIERKINQLKRVKHNR